MPRPLIVLLDAPDRYEPSRAAGHRASAAQGANMRRKDACRTCSGEVTQGLAAPRLIEGRLLIECSVVHVLVAKFVEPRGSVQCPVHREEIGRGAYDID